MALVHRHSFGIKADVRDNIWYIDELNVVFPVGNNIVLHNVEQKIQKFIAGGAEKTEGITSMAVSPTLKYVAVAERGDRPYVAVYDLSTLKRRRLLSTPDVLSKEYVCLSFSSDAKFLLTQGGPPDWTLVLWSWEKTKVLCFGRVAVQPEMPICETSICPYDSNVAIVVGDGCLKFLRNVEGTWKPVPGGLGKREPENNICHAWLTNERVIVGTDNGNLLLFESFDFKTVLIHSPDNGSRITKIVPYKKGFVCGCDGGMLLMYEKSEEKMEYFKRSKWFKVENNHVPILSMSVSPSEENLAISLQNHQVFNIPFSNTEFAPSEEMAFEPLFQPFHSKEITGLDVCVLKPLIVTCSTDKSVRIWNYLDKTLEQWKEFHEEAMSVAYHPSGFFVLVGFQDKLRLMNVLMDDIRMFREMSIKNCRECRFSNGGQYFAAAHGNAIQIYNTHSGDLMANLRGHNAKVRSLSFSNNDTKLVSSGMDGGVYEWIVHEGKRAEGHVVKTCNYSSAIMASDERTMLCCGSDKMLRAIVDSEVTVIREAGLCLTQLMLSHSQRLLFAGCENGAIRAYRFPITGEYHEYPAHIGRVTRVRVAVDDSYLFTTGEDGSLMMFDIRDKDSRRDKKEPTFSEEILVSKADLEEKTQLTAELEGRVKDLVSQNEYQLKIMEKTHEDQTKEMNLKFQQELEKENNKYEYLQTEKNEMEMDFEEKLRHQEERHTAAMQELEQTYTQKIMQELEKYQTLSQEKELEAEKFEEQHQLLVEQHNRLVTELQEEFEFKIADQDAVIEQMAQEAEEQEKVLEETRRMIEEDCDQEIEQVKREYEEKLATEKENLLKLKGDNGLIKKKNAQLQKKWDDQDTVLKAEQEKNNELDIKIKTCERDIAGLKKEIKERDETIGDKEKRIYDLKKKNQELEKFKFVLDYKIKELRKQIEPKDLEINGMKETIKEMDAELERYNKTNQAFELDNSSLQLKLDALQKELLKQRTQLADADALNRRFRTDLEETVQYIQDYKMLKASVKLLYQRHCGEPVQSTHLDEDVQKEYTRQREYLEKSVENLKRKLAKDTDLHRYEATRFMQENASLIKEINDLRREIKILKAQNNRGKEQPPKSAGNKSRTSTATGGQSRGGDNAQVRELQRELEMQRDEMAKMRTRLAELEALTANRGRPISREKLPPVEGASDM